MSKKIIQIIGFAATLLGIGATVATDWANEKKMERMIDEKIDKALTDRNVEEEDEDNLQEAEER